MKKTTAFDAVNSYSRDQWAVAAVVGIRESLTPEGWKNLVLGGEKQFVGVARSGFRGQDFMDSDYRRMFRMIQLPEAELKKLIKLYFHTKATVQ